jgi:hypothetical protein
VDHKVFDVENNFLQKPFTLKQLAGKVRTILDFDGKVAHLATETSTTSETVMATPV